MMNKNNEKYQCSGIHQLGKYTINYVGNYVVVLNSAIDGKAALIFTDPEISSYRGKIILDDNDKLQFEFIYMSGVKVKMKENTINIICNFTY